MKKILLLGGTADGRVLAETLHKYNIPIIYSIAGLVRTPKINCDIVSGGFTQFGGLQNFIRQKNVNAILDVTHPYAQTMSTKAVSAAKACGIPYWRFHREAWQAQEGDIWKYVDDWQAVLPSLTQKKSIFLTAGQLNQQWIDALYEETKNSEQRQFLRTAVKPKMVLPPSMKWIKAIGPFSYENELTLMQEYKVDALLSKNSGGESTVAKLHVARELGINVFMLNRPVLPDADKTFYSRDECSHFIIGNN